MPDAYVQVATDGAGKKVDTSELTRADGTVVERQRVVIASPSDPNRLAEIDSEGVQVAGMGEIRFLLMRQNALLFAIAMQLGVSIDPDQLLGS